MKKRSKRDNPEQIVKKLRDADVMLSVGKSIEEILKVLEVSEATFHRWRNQYGGIPTGFHGAPDHFLGSVPLIVKT